MKKYILFLIIFVIFFFASNSLYADNFHPTNDYINNKVFVTTFFGLGDLAMSESEHYTIEYNLNSVLGSKSDSLVENYSWGNYVSLVGGRYRRILGINDDVWVPGNSNIDVFAIVKNETGHEVTLRELMFFTSRDNLDLVDLSALGIESLEGGINYRFMGQNARKYGRFLYSPLVLVVDENETKIVKLMTLNVGQPLQIEYFNWEPNILENGDLVVDFILKLKNTTAFTVRNVEFIHKNYHLQRNYPAFDEYTYSYQVNYGKNYSAGLNLLDSFEIRRNFLRTECLVYGSSLSNYYHGDGKSLAYERSDQTGGMEFFGKSVDLDWYPEGHAMCITLMMYRLVGKKLHYYTPINVEVNFLGEGGTLGINDDLEFLVSIENKQEGLDSFEVKLKFDLSNQVLKSSSCNFLTQEDGILLKIFNLEARKKVFCSLKFEILNKSSFLNLEQSLILNGDTVNVIVFKYLPNLEFSFDYDFEKKQFVFVSNASDISRLISNENYERGFLCRRVEFFDLTDEVCL